MRVSGTIPRSLLTLALAVVVATLGFPLAPAGATPPVTAFSLDSEAGDYIGQGQSLVYVPPAANVGATPYGAGLQMSATQDGHWWYALVTPPTGQALAPGTYDATRSATSTTAGLDVFGDGRGCNTSTGTLTVHEVSFAGDGTVERFAASYEQHCEGGSKALYGELRYNSNFEFQAASISPSSHTFGTLQLGETSAPQSATVTNTGSESLTFGSAAISGDGAGDFSISSDSCSGSSLGPGGTCAVDVIFSPAARGTRTALLRVPEDTRRSGRDITLSGTATGITTSLSLSKSASVVNYGQSVKLSTHLGAHLDSTNKTVDFYKTPYGGSKTLVAAKQVDASGNASVNVTMKKKTTFVVEWDGDARYEPAASPTRVIEVRAIAKLSLLGGYGVSGKYKLYHNGDPIQQKGTVVPNHAGNPLEFIAQQYLSGRWRTVATGRFTIGSNGSVVAVFRNGVRGTYRSKTRFDGDQDHLADSSPWKYFKVTA